MSLSNFWESPKIIYSTFTYCKFLSKLHLASIVETCMSRNRVSLFQLLHNGSTATRTPLPWYLWQVNLLSHQWLLCEHSFLCCPVKLLTLPTCLELESYKEITVRNYFKKTQHWPQKISYFVPQIFLMLF